MDKIRKEIDNIDEEIFQLLERRFSLTDTIGKYKKENNILIRDSKREEEIKLRMEKLENKIEIKEIYERIFELSKKRQK